MEPLNSATLPNTPEIELTEIREAQRNFFRSGITLDLDFRISMLRQLLGSIHDHEHEILQALEADLGKSEFEAYSNEVGLVYTEIRYMIKHLKKWARAKGVFPDLPLLPGKGTIKPEPYGSVVIMAPWNYPMQLLFLPLVGALAAGNTVVLKPSEVAIHTARVSQKIIESTFKNEYLALVQGGPSVSQTLIDLNFDYLFFTGSVPVGKQIMEAAAKHLTPITLELGGKSPVFVDESADLSLAAKKIALGKFNNAGQTCVAPDYVLVHQSVADQFVEQLKQTIEEFYGSDPKTSGVYGAIINTRHFDRLESLLADATIYSGGKRIREDRYFEPTVVYPAQWNQKLMEDEIFGPILPVLTYESLEDAVYQVQSRPKPLALYVFTKNSRVKTLVTQRISFGGGCINSTLFHVASHKLPFGGVGPSGLGNYHGRASFDTFSHYKSLLIQPASFDLGLAYPNKKLSVGLLRKVLK
jgi:aldehyde dehydrogenase (NAD+)